MSHTEPRREWVIQDEYSFNYKLWNLGLISIFGIGVRFNFRYVINTIKSANHIVLGGSWNDLNVLFIVILKRMGFISKKISFWSEANYLTLGSRKKNKVKHFVRRWIFNTADGYYFIPGKIAEITLNKWGVNIDKKKCVILPNLPHKKFENYIGSWVGSKSIRPVFVIVARLDEKTKGIMNFFKCIGADRIRSVEFIVIGSGPDLDGYQQYVNSMEFGDSIKFTGNLSTDDIISQLRISDVFVLPSYSDQNPLSVIEACKIGLPLLLSKMCGNHIECLAEGQNGYGFNPYDKDEILRAFDNIMKSMGSWTCFSHKSVEMSRLNFNREKICSSIADYL